MRLALYFDKRIQEIASTPTADTNGWFNVIGETPLATVFQTAFGLPSSFGNLNIDAQRDVYKIINPFGTDLLKPIYYGHQLPNNLPHHHHRHRFY
jgi:hypothetical protein